MNSLRLFWTCLQRVATTMQSDGYTNSHTQTEFNYMKYLCTKICCPSTHRVITHSSAQIRRLNTFLILSIHFLLFLLHRRLFFFLFFVSLSLSLVFQFSFVNVCVCVMKVIVRLKNCFFPKINCWRKILTYLRMYWEWMISVNATNKLIHNNNLFPKYYY